MDGQIEVTALPAMLMWLVKITTTRKINELHGALDLQKNIIKYSTDYKHLQCAETTKTKMTELSAGLLLMQMHTYISNNIKSQTAKLLHQVSS